MLSPSQGQGKPSQFCSECEVGVLCPECRESVLAPTQNQKLHRCLSCLTQEQVDQLSPMQKLRYSVLLPEERELPLIAKVATFTAPAQSGNGILTERIEG